MFGWVKIFSPIGRDFIVLVILWSGLYLNENPRLKVLECEQNLVKINRWDYNMVSGLGDYSR